MVLFDLGDTLEINNKLREDTIETLSKITELKDTQGNKPILALASDFYHADTPEELINLKKQYYDILDGLGIKHFFEPVQKNVVLSSEVGYTKSENPKKFFQKVIEKNGSINICEIIFITENEEHIESAKVLDMSTIHMRFSPANSNEMIHHQATRLLDTIPLIREFLKNE